MTKIAVAHKIYYDWNVTKDKYRCHKQILPPSIISECIDMKTGQHLIQTSTIANIALVLRLIRLTFILSHRNEE